MFSWVVFLYWQHATVPAAPRGETAATNVHDTFMVPLPSYLPSSWKSLPLQFLVSLCIKSHNFSSILLLQKSLVKLFTIVCT